MITTEFKHAFVDDLERRSVPELQMLLRAYLLRHDHHHLAMIEDELEDRGECPNTRFRQTTELLPTSSIPITDYRALAYRRETTMSNKGLKVKLPSGVIRLIPLKWRNVSYFDPEDEKNTVAYLINPGTRPY